MCKPVSSGLLRLRLGVEGALDKNIKLSKENQSLRAWPTYKCGYLDQSCKMVKHSYGTQNALKKYWKMVELRILCAHKVSLQISNAEAIFGHTICQQTQIQTPWDYWIHPKSLNTPIGVHPKNSNPPNGIEKTKNNNNEAKII